MLEVVTERELSAAKLAGLRIACRHWTLRPYRNRVGKIATSEVSSPEFVKTRRQDIASNIFMRGYREATGLPVPSRTGLAVVLYILWIHFVDNAVDYLPDGSELPRDFHALATTLYARELWTAMERYSNLHYGDDRVIQPIHEYINIHYDEYRRLYLTHQSSPCFDSNINLVTADTGLSVGLVYEIIRSTNQHAPDQSCLREFMAMGLAGKFCDDIADYSEDVSCGRSNLLHSLLLEKPLEHDCVARARQRNEVLTLSWWNANCPRTMAEYSSRFADYYREVRALSLRLAVNLHLALLASPTYWRHQPDHWRRRSWGDP